jgi:hypothetical protein
MPEPCVCLIVNCPDCKGICEDATLTIISGPGGKKAKLEINHGDEHEHTYNWSILEDLPPPTLK